MRVGLVIVGSALFGLAVPELNSRAHSGNEVASWTVAAAVGLVGAAVSPRRVDGHTTRHGATVVVPVRGLGEGGYVLVWRVS